MTFYCCPFSNKVLLHISFTMEASMHCIIKKAILHCEGVAAQRRANFPDITVAKTMHLCFRGK